MASQDNKNVQQIVN